MSATPTFRNRRRFITPVRANIAASMLFASVALVLATMPVRSFGHDLDWAAFAVAAFMSVLCALMAALSARSNRVYDRRGQGLRVLPRR
jgi:hypothetical protein